jgi:hypothetical protein
VYEQEGRDGKDKLHVANNVCSGRWHITQSHSQFTKYGMEDLQSKVEKSTKKDEVKAANIIKVLTLQKKNRTAASSSNEATLDDISVPHFFSS